MALGQWPDVLGEPLRLTERPVAWQRLEEGFRAIAGGDLLGISCKIDSATGVDLDVDGWSDGREVEPPSQLHSAPLDSEDVAGHLLALTQERIPEVHPRLDDETNPRPGTALRSDEAGVVGDPEPASLYRLKKHSHC